MMSKYYKYALSDVWRVYNASCVQRSMSIVFTDPALVECVRCVVWGDEVPHHWGEVREADQSCPSAADGKYEWLCTSTPHVT
jgi:hypothetical protein